VRIYTYNPLLLLLLADQRRSTFKLWPIPNRQKCPNCARQTQVGTFTYKTQVNRHIGAAAAMKALLIKVWA
jgi:hypothetical protein